MIYKISIHKFGTLISNRIVIHNHTFDMMTFNAKTHTNTFNAMCHRHIFDAMYHTNIFHTMYRTNIFDTICHKNIFDAKAHRNSCDIRSFDGQTIYKLNKQTEWKHDNLR